MPTEEKLEAIRKLVEPLAARETWADSFDEDTCVDDFAGGNVDKAYYGGENAGETELARKILELLK